MACSSQPMASARHPTTRMQHRPPSSPDPGPPFVADQAFDADRCSRAGLMDYRCCRSVVLRAEPGLKTSVLLFGRPLDRLSR